MHRFYVGNTKTKAGKLELRERIWVNDAALVNQVLRVLRMRVGEKLVLFDGVQTERMYEINEVEANGFHLVHVTDLAPKAPTKKVYLAFSLLKKDKVEWVLQKATELGVSHFVPIISERTEKLGFDEERAEKIVIEASEQCGRHDVPTVTEPRTLKEVLGEFEGKVAMYYTHMGGDAPKDDDKVMVFVGPEGGWTETELQIFAEKGVGCLGLGDFVLRAETAAISAVQKLV